MLLELTLRRQRQAEQHYDSDTLPNKTIEYCFVRGTIGRSPKPTGAKQSQNSELPFNANPSNSHCRLMRAQKLCEPVLLEVFCEMNN